jgi:hypothetical protein
MSNNGLFTVEDDDIIKLESTNDSGSRMGWVNVGTHAVQLTLDSEGGLVVEVCARTNEGKPLGACVVTKQASIEAGGVDPDADADENEVRPA